MSIQFSTALRNARLDAIETLISTSAKLVLLTGAAPGILQTDTGNVLATLDLPSDYLAAASSGAKAKNGTWSGTGSGAGSAGHFSLRASDGTTRHIEGSITATGGGGDMTLDNIVIAVGQAITVTGFTLTDGNAGS